MEAGWTLQEVGGRFEAQDPGDPAAGVGRKVISLVGAGA